VSSHNIATSRLIGSYCVVHLSAIEAIEADIAKYRERIRAKAEALETITDPKDLNQAC
jgi:hypothetical protein